MADLVPDREGFLEEGEHRVRWEYVGKGDKEAVCLLNGLGGGERWTRLVSGVGDL